MAPLLFSNVTTILPDKLLTGCYVLCEKGKIWSISQRCPKSRWEQMGEDDRQIKVDRESLFRFHLSLLRH
jgi:hypothetical protein